MADYCNLVSVKTYIGANQTTDDALITDLISQACAAIDSYCGRSFVGRAETRVFDALRDTEGRTLYVDDDLQSVTTVTNGDSEVLDSADYVLLPANFTPKYALQLKSSRGKSWNYITDPEQAISVNGTWGYSAGTVPPDDIQHAAIRLSAWYYHQRQAPFEEIGLSDLGQSIVPSAMPKDIERLLSPYRRLRFGAIK